MSIRIIDDGGTMSRDEQIEACRTFLTAMKRNDVCVRGDNKDKDIPDNPLVMQFFYMWQDCTWQVAGRHETHHIRLDHQKHMKSLEELLERELWRKDSKGAWHAPMVMRNVESGEIVSIKPVDVS